MKSKKRLRSLLVIAMILLFSPFINYALACFNLPPVFAVPTAKYKDGGTVVYRGLGHTIIDYNELKSFNSREDVVFISRFLNKGEPNPQDKRWER